MTTNTLDIVSLIEQNPATRLSGTYQSKLLTKIQEAFTTNEQQLFVASFYCYVNYDPVNDFVIDLDTIWLWLGFQKKFTAKRLLENHFIKDVEYKTTLHLMVEQRNHTIGGHNREIIMLNVKSFKKMCLKASTPKAGELLDYFLKLEQVLCDVIQEESNELRLQLAQKDEVLNLEVCKIREKTLIDQFPVNTQCIYYGFIDNVSSEKEPEALIKFGNSNNLKGRVFQHKRTYTNFRLVNAFKVENKLQVESALKTHEFFINRIRQLTINQKRYVELLSLKDITTSDVDKSIKDVIKQIEFSRDNYQKLFVEKQDLQEKLTQALEDNQTTNLFIANTEIARLRKENSVLVKRLKAVCLKYNVFDNAVSLDVTDDMDHYHPMQYNDLLLPKLKKYMKNADGLYEINGHFYPKLIGTRQEVWDLKAFQTAGNLLKSELILNKTGQIVSKKKSISESQNKRFK
jgi:hypothetical protein